MWVCVGHADSAVRRTHRAAPRARRSTFPPRLPHTAADSTRQVKDSLCDEKEEDVPLACLLAVQEGTRLHVYPSGSMEEVLVELEVGDLLVFRGDLGHAGAGYDGLEHVRPEPTRQDQIRRPPYEIMTRSLTRSLPAPRRSASISSSTPSPSHGTRA